MTNLVAGQEYYVSKWSITDAIYSKNPRTFIGTDRDGKHWFEYDSKLDVEGSHPTCWTNIVEIPTKPELVPWTQGTCPPILPSWAIRHNGYDTSTIFLVTAITIEGIMTYKTLYKWKYLRDWFEYSLDGVEWRPCGVKE